MAATSKDDLIPEVRNPVSLVEKGWATQIEVAGAFSQSARTLRRQQSRFEDGRLAALGRTKKEGLSPAVGVRAANKARRFASRRRALGHQGQIGYCRTDRQAVRNDDYAWHGLTGLHAFEGVFGNCVHVVRKQKERLLATRGQ